MALRLGIGRLFGLLRPRFGVKGGLFAAFAVIAAMAIIISAGAGFVFRHLGSVMIDFSGRDIPRLAASLQLQAQSATLAAQGPAVLASQSEETLKERTAKVAEIQKLTMDKLGEIIELGADKDIVAALRETVKNINDATASLGSAARGRLDAGAQHNKAYAAL